MAAVDAVKQATDAPVHPPERVRRTTIIVCVLLAFVAVIWEREAELMAFACQISESVPPMTSLGFLIALVALGLLARKAAGRVGSVNSGLARLFERMAMSGSQIMYVYAFVTVTTIIFSVGVIRTILPEMATMTYFADYSNDFAEARPFVNDVLQVTDPEAVRQYYEGADAPIHIPNTGEIPVISTLINWSMGAAARTQLVPWRFWLVPLAMWSLFMLALFFTMQCIAGLCEREWTLSERLPYPLVEIPLGMTGKRSFVPGTPLLRDAVMWVGFALGAGYGLHEMLAATTFAFPMWGREYALGQLLTEHPWSVIGGGINVFIMPEAYGLAYFASQDVLITTAVTWIGYMLFTVLMAASGRQLEGGTYRNASAGSFVGFVAAAIWVARKPLARALFGAFGVRTEQDEKVAPLTEAHFWMMRGALLGLAFLIGFLIWMGLPLHYVVFIIAMFFVGAIGHARVRAVAGAATPWLFPHSSMSTGYVELFGAGAIGRQGDYRPFAAIFHLKWLDRGYPHSGLAANLESYNMTRRGGMDFGDMTRVMLLAIPIGLALGWWMHLTAFYDHGANVLGGGTYAGGVRVRYAHQDADWAIGLVNAPIPGKPGAIGAALVGLLITVGGLVLRNINLRFPFHPAGFVIGMNHGRRFWAPFLIVWGIKSLLLKIGGVGAYRRLMPAFLGIVIGHFFFVGIIMGLAKTTGLPVFERLPIIWF